MTPSLTRRKSIKFAQLNLRFPGPHLVFQGDYLCELLLSGPWGIPVLSRRAQLRVGDRSPHPRTPRGRVDTDPRIALHERGDRPRSTARGTNAAELVLGDMKHALFPTGARVRFPGRKTPSKDSDLLKVCDPVVPHAIDLLKEKLKSALAPSPFADLERTRLEPFDAVRRERFEDEAPRSPDGDVPHE